MVKCELKWIAKELKYSITPWSWKDVVVFVSLWVFSCVLMLFVSWALWVIFFVVCCVVANLFGMAYQECKRQKREEKKPTQFEKITVPFGAKIYYKPLESAKKRTDEIPNLGNLLDDLRECALVNFPIIGRIKRYIWRHRNEEQTT